MNKLFTTVVLVLAFQLTVSAYYVNHKEVSMHMISQVPDPLIVHCKSGDDDLGYKTIATGQEWSWDFDAKFFGGTLFFCHWYWGSQQAVFDVFNKHLSAPCNIQWSSHYECFWEARVDGFYLGNDGKSYVKMHNWGDH